MNAGYHHSKALKLLEEAEKMFPQDTGPWVSMAQVHATLALAASTEAQTELVANSWDMWGKRS